MFNSPSSSDASPLRNVVANQVHQFLGSPSDSRVPRTPNVPPQNVSLDQSVPLTPDGCRSLDLPVSTVFRTPNRAASWPDSTPPQLLFEQHSPVSQGISLRSTPHSPDQLVPSTPKDKNKLRRSSLTEQLLSSSPMSPVPRSTGEPSARQTLFDITGISPVRPSPPVASTSFHEIVSPTLKFADTNVGESRCLSTSFGKKNGSNHLGGSGVALCPASIADTSYTRRQSMLSSAGQGKSDLSRKCPPSKRRLSLDRQGQKDGLRRAAQHNLAFQRSLAGVMFGNSSCSTPLHDSPQQDCFEEIFPSADVNVSHHDSGFSEILTQQSKLAEAYGQCGTETLSLTSPAGDATNVLVDGKAKLALQNGSNLAADLGIDTLPGASAQTFSGVEESKEGPKKKEPTHLDLFNGDNIFG